MRRTFQWSGATLLLTVALAAVAPSLEAQQGLDGIEAEVESMVEAWNLPGLALVVVQDDRIAYAGGFGVQEIDGDTPVDEHTIFAVGSTSKAFTAAAMAMLVDDGSVKWDDPVLDHLPDFRLSDPYVTRQMRVRDLMAHNSGLLRGDRIWYASGRTRDEVLHQARYQPMTFPLRATFQYNNIMWIAAGEVIEARAGKTWDEYLDTRLFTPLGMARSSTSVKPLENMENVATPHIELPDGSLKAIPYRNIDNAGPAGSINSSALEMAQWVRLQLGMGEYEGKRLISEEAVAEMHTGQMIMRKEGTWGLIFPASDFLSYGLGWFLSDYRDLKMVSHGGNIDGMTAFVAFVPERNYGFVMLVNLGGANAFVSALTHRLIDRMEDGEGPPWSDQMLEGWQGFQEQARKQAQEVEDSRIADTSPTLELEGYAGTYRSAMYGDITVELHGEHLAATFGEGYHGPLEHWHHDTFRANWHDPTDAKEFFRFEIGTDGSVAALHAEIEGSQEFARVPAEEDDPGDL